MKNKLKYLVKYGLNRKFKSKYFIVVNILLLILIPALINIDKVIEFFGGEFDDPTNIIVVDEVGAYDTFENIYNQSSSYSMEVTDIVLSKSDKTRDELTKDLKENKSKNIVIVLSENKENIFSAEIITYDYIDTFLYQTLTTSLNSTKTNIALLKSNIDKEELANVYSNIEIRRVFLDEELDENSEFMSMISNFLVPVLILPFFFLIILVVQSIGAEINEEKSSKSMEIIISSISPKTHFLSKIISTNVFIITQGVLLVVYAIVGMVLRTQITNTNLIDSFGVDISAMFETFANSGMLNDILMAIPFIIIIMLLSFLAYSLMAGIFASMTTSIEDYQQIQTPIMLLMLTGYYLAIFSSVYDSAIFVKVLSYVPFISAILAPVLLIMGQINMLDIAIAVLLLVLVNYLFIKYGLKVYKAGILNYSSSKLWKKMLKAVKEK